MIQVVGCCDVGGSTVRVGLATRDGSLLAKKTYAHSAPDPRATLEVVARTLEDLARSARTELRGVGAAVPGPLDPQRGIVYFSPNLRWHDFPFGRELSARLNLRTAIDDDANCAALGEQWLGIGKGVRDLIYVIVGTGIGAGLILNGDLYHGARGLAGELGHTTIQAQGPLFACGNRGCLEALAAGPALVERMNNLARSRASCPATAREVIGMARAGDVMARQVLTEAGEWLGIGLANAINLLNPEIVALGGGVALDAGELLLAPARRVIRQRAFASAAESARVVLGVLGNDAGLIGAARLAWQS
jgi:glucokinase